MSNIGIGYLMVTISSGCFVPEEELALAKSQHRWWQNMLGPHYRGFFTSDNSPKANFKKIMHLKTWDDLLTRYPGMTVVWAHLGLSKVPSRNNSCQDKIVISYTFLGAEASSPDSACSHHLQASGQTSQPSCWHQLGCAGQAALHELPQGKNIQKTFNISRENMTKMSIHSGP